VRACAQSEPPLAFEGLEEVRILVAAARPRVAKVSKNPVIDLGVETALKALQQPVRVDDIGILATVVKGRGMSERAASFWKPF